jgi:putative colanic acid biosynthesis glycosyltransferase
MQRRPSFSVITVVRDNRAGFERTARSVVAQKDANFEWIVIDGASTDGTVDAIRTYASRIAYWTSKKDAGVYHGMNDGLVHASKDYVLFLNSGDVFCSEHSLGSVADAAAGLTTGVSMILGGAILEYPFGHRVVLKARRAENYIHHSNPTTHQATFLHRELHQSLPYDTSYRIAGDYHCICSMFLKDARCAYVDDAVVAVIRGGDSFSHRHPLVHARECIRVQRDVLGLAYPVILRSLARRSVSYVAEAMLSRKPLAPIAWRIVQARRSAKE